jgi:formate hydrogenlyase subunit 4
MLELIAATLGQALHLVLMLAAAPLLVGLVRTAKARLVGRVGPPPLQPWRDLARLLRKQPVVAPQASWLFGVAPAAGLSAVLVAAMLVPSFATGMLLAPLSDMLVLAGLLALARVIAALAAMDTATSFGGIGASRDLTFASFAEPAFLLATMTLSLLAGTTALDGIVAALRDGQVGLRVSLGLCLLGLSAVAIAENARIPTDNPATHLELTMVHEAMVLEYSGRHLAMVELNAALRLTLWLSLIAALFFPFGIASSVVGWPLGLLAWAVKLAVLGLGLAAFETSIAKMRVFRVPEFLGAALLLTLLAAIFLFVSKGLA